MRGGISATEWKVIPLASDTVEVFHSPEPETLHAGHPSLVVLPSGRMIAAFDLWGPGLKKTAGAKGKIEEFQRLLQGQVFVSNDHGKTWSHKFDFPFCNPLLFRDGHALYLIGHADTMQIIRSPDGGETWSKPVELAPGIPVGDTCSQSPASILAANGSLYMAILRLPGAKRGGDMAATTTPVVLRATQGVNLASAKSWSASEPGPAFRDLLAEGADSNIGTPFFNVPDRDRGRDVGGGRWAHRIGWSALHLVQVADRDHYWHDPAGRTFHLLARGSTHRSNLAVLLRVVETEAALARFDPQLTPAGTRQLFLPLPGGHLKFDIFYDSPSRLFWLVSSQATDSMTRPERLRPERYRLPAEELHRLQLHFSRNLVDWNFAGYVTGGQQPRESHHTPSVAVRGNDLCVLCSTGLPTDRSAQDTAVIAFHCIPNFRELVY